MSQRRLAAIMFTDIVGYDSLLKEDEKKAFEYLRKNQRIHKRLIKSINTILNFKKLNITHLLARNMLIKLFGLARFQNHVLPMTS